ncbi:hypothetical protein RHMOL_Rhmol13G0109200 [Rhododendron molle]|uniref:Uncharacterized protein n=1 Tax=Rhododendron molle TaxID=49168 RepID=A0ACC0L5L3_RHOML|nr:hypothetical protein RHMOL_Rhmol13G0109200 [Rhododendron molle]
MIEQNHALLAKWWWRFSREKDSLWAKVVCRKYGFSHQDWLPQLPSSGRVSIIWRDICSIGNPDSEMGNIIQAGFKLQVYSGNNFKCILGITRSFGITNGWAIKHYKAGLRLDQF